MAAATAAVLRPLDTGAGAGEAAAAAALAFVAAARRLVVVAAAGVLAGAVPSLVVER